MCPFYNSVSIMIQSFMLFTRFLTLCWAASHWVHVCSLANTLECLHFHCTFITRSHYAFLHHNRQTHITAERRCFYTPKETKQKVLKWKPHNASEYANAVDGSGVSWNGLKEKGKSSGSRKVKEKPRRGENQYANLFI